MEAMNESSKLVAQTIEKLKYARDNPWVPPYSVEREIEECLSLLEDALIKLTNAM